MTPGTSCTTASRRPRIRLTRVDLPTFGRPTTATTGGGAELVNGCRGVFDYFPVAFVGPGAVTHRSARARSSTTLTKCCTTSASLMSLVSTMIASSAGRRGDTVSRRIQVIAPLHIGQHGRIIIAEVVVDVLVVTPTCACLGCGGQKEFHIRVRQHHRADVAPFHHHTADTGGQPALQPHQALAYGRYGGHNGYRAGHIIEADPQRNILSPKVAMDLVRVVPHRQGNIGRCCSDGVRIGQVDARAQHVQRHDPIHRSSVEVAGTQRMCQSLRDRRLPGAGRAIDRDRQRRVHNPTALYSWPISSFRSGRRLPGR